MLKNHNNQMSEKGFKKERVFQDGRRSSQNRKKKEKEDTE